MRRLLARKGASQSTEGGDDAQVAVDGQSPSPSSSVMAFSTASLSGSGSLSRKSTSDDAGAYNNALAALKAIPLPADPEAFIEAALGPIFNHNPKHDLLTFQDVVTHHVPRFFSLDYRHQVNCDELDLEGAPLRSLCALLASQACSDCSPLRPLPSHCRLAQPVVGHTHESQEGAHPLRQVVH